MGFRSGDLAGAGFYLCKFEKLYMQLRKSFNFTIIIPTLLINVCAKLPELGHYPDGLP